MITRNKATDQSLIILYGLASLIDGLIMILSLGLLLSSFRHATSLWIARRRR